LNEAVTAGITTKESRWHQNSFLGTFLANLILERDGYHWNTVVKQTQSEFFSWNYDQRNPMAPELFGNSSIIALGYCAFKQGHLILEGGG